MSFKAIPTRYAGVLFRSRLEARWARFLDELDVKWEYEPQGYATDGEPYLCDFVIFAACGTLWAEVKPDWKTDPEGIARWRRFAAQRPQPSRAVLLTGTPAPELKLLVVGGTWDEPWEDDQQEWRPCPSGRHFDVAFPGPFHGRAAEDGCPWDADGFIRGEDRLRRAITGARSARFDLRHPDAEA